MSSEKWEVESGKWKVENDRFSLRFYRFCTNSRLIFFSVFKVFRFLHPASWIILIFGSGVLSVQAQIVIDPAVKKVEPEQIMPVVSLTIGRYLDPVNGTTADETVRIALENNGEIKALRDELEAARAKIKQAGLRPNPQLKITGSQEGIIGNRYSGGASVSLPLELGGRRRARIGVAENQFKVREARLADSERKLAAEVRTKFGEALARIEKLKFLEELLGNVEQGYKLISAGVTEGSNAPLEQNMSLVELNRIRSMRETAVANVEIKLLELRNVLGLDPLAPLRLKGDFGNLIGGIPSRTEALEQAVLNRPDLESLRLMLGLGNAELEKERTEGKLDAGVSLGFQRMTRIQPFVTGQNPVELTPNRIGENFITFGVELKLPVRNKNQGNIESAALAINAADKRLDFGELTVRREVVAAYTKFEAAVRALTIYRVGVRQQAKENLQVVWQTYELGDKDLVDYISEERRYLELENDLIDAELEVYLARVEIYRAINAPELIKK
jgi:cobalt-zinc-cadmium efflux system outer membrane protein